MNQFFVGRIILALLTISADLQIYGVEAQSSKCAIDGKSFDHNPKKGVKSQDQICFCDNGAWTNCFFRTGSPQAGAAQAATGGSGGTKNRSLTAQETRVQFQPQDFVADLRGSAAAATGKGGEARLLLLPQFPALAGHDLGLALFNLEPCGINLPHVHPRADEMLYMIKGTMQTAFTEENGGRTIINDLTEGMATLIPQGLIQFQQNLGCQPIQFLSALNSEDPGIVTLGNLIFTLPNEALQATFALSRQQVETIKQGIPAGPASGRAECLKRCNLPADSL